MSRFSRLARSGSQPRRETRGIEENPGRSKKPEITQADIESVTEASFSAARFIAEELSADQEVAEAMATYTRKLGEYEARGIDVSHIPPLSRERVTREIEERRRKQMLEAMEITDEEKLIGLLGINASLKAI